MNLYFSSHLTKFFIIRIRTPGDECARRITEYLNAGCVIYLVEVDHGMRYGCYPTWLGIIYLSNSVFHSSYRTRLHNAGYSENKFEERRTFAMTENPGELFALPFLCIIKLSRIIMLTDLTWQGSLFTDIGIIYTETHDPSSLLQALSDLLLGVFCIPFTLLGQMLKNFVFGTTMCRLIPYFQGEPTQFTFPSTFLSDP